MMINEEKYNELKNKYQYLAADFSNYKRRTEENIDIIKKESNKEIIFKLLTMVDDMDRLLTQCYMNELSYEPKDNIDIITSGFQLIFENLIKLLESEGCQKIEVACGDKFNPEFHEAIWSRPVYEDEGFKPGDICEIYQSGWMLNGKLLRPTKVKVVTDD